MTVRTRIAPSPTGDPHVGTAYIALFNRCFAKQHQGQFVLRIEDTDRQRSTSHSEQAILDSLRWLGLDWDEGPDVGGDYGPYRQSERSDLYKQYAQQLVDEGKAFICFRTAEELDEIRECIKASGEHRAIKHKDLVLEEQEFARRQSRGDASVIRLHVPDAGECVVKDMLRGDMLLDWANVDAQILLKSDGMPTYHLANIVDDHLMKITHVIRGEEWINSAPKHQLLYSCFGWDMPELCHLPLLRNPDKSKLSKRKNPTSIAYYQRMGFLPEAVVNFLGRMGWSMPDEREKFSLAEMQEAFDIQRVSLGGPIFDIEKLRWLNGLWIRESLSDEELAQRLHDWIFNKPMLMQLIPFVKPRMEALSDFVPVAGFVASGMLAINADDFAANKLDTEQQLQVLQWSLRALEEPSIFPAGIEKDVLFAQFKAMAAVMDVKVKDFLAPLFIAIAGTTSSFSVLDAIVLLGADLSRARIRHAIEVLGGVSKKKAKAWEKAFQQYLHEQSSADEDELI